VDWRWSEQSRALFFQIAVKQTKPKAKQYISAALATELHHLAATLPPIATQ